MEKQKLMLIDFEYSSYNYRSVCLIVDCRTLSSKRLKDIETCGSHPTGQSKHFCQGFMFPHMFQHEIDWVLLRIHGHPSSEMQCSVAGEGSTAANGGEMGTFEQS